MPANSLTSPKSSPDDASDLLPKGIGKPATRALALRGITRLSQLPAVSERELLALHGVGPKAVRILRETLTECGLSFGTSDVKTP